jgi:hypothetical protein
LDIVVVMREEMNVKASRYPAIYLSYTWDTIGAAKSHCTKLDFDLDQGSPKLAAAHP